jgi:hypothetical protein
VRNGSAIDSSRISREPVVQIWPALKKPLNRTPATAWSMSASRNTTLGLFPPSSRVTGRTRSAAARRISLPTAVLPVNEILSMWGWRTRAAPVSGPPLTTLTTPGGMPASRQIFPSSTVLSGVCSAILRTTVLPAASAGASLMHELRSG